MKIARVFSKAGVPVEEQIEWRTLDVRIEDGTGRAIFEMAAVEVPVHWSDNAAQILASKYFRKAEVPSETVHRKVFRAIDDPLPQWLRPRVPASDACSGSETSAKQVFHRLAGCWTYWGVDEGLIDNDHAHIFYDELYMMLALQVGAPNSPQWFNTGLYWAYGIEGPANGQWVLIHGDPCQTLNAYERPQPHACFIQPVKDDLVNPGGIMDLWVREARLFKHGSGTGTNFSTLRAKGEALSGGGVASGVMSWLRIGDRAAGAIQSGGTTRRAAKMVILDLDHPEIEEFIDWKVREESKAAAMYIGSAMHERAFRTDSWHSERDLVPDQLIERTDIGFKPEVYGIGWEGIAIDTVDGQNSNNSVRVTDEFMHAVEHRTYGTPWCLTERVTGKVAKILDPLYLWDKICRAAWASADPGIQFEDTINDWHTCLADGEIRASNPCGEYQFLDNTACNLASLNLCRFLIDRGQSSILDLDAYEHAIRLWTMVLEISVHMASFPSAEIAVNSHDYRTLGLGYSNLGGLLMRMAIPYDSNGGRHLAAALTAFMTAVAYRTSAEMADLLGPFPRWQANREAMQRVLLNHCAAIGIQSFVDLRIEPPELDEEFIPRDLWARLVVAWNEVIEGKDFRNAQTTLIAPTGTISFVMDCDTTGIEPDFALIKHKNLAGGGSMKIVNQAVGDALRALDYEPDQIARVMEYIEHHGTITGGDSPLHPEHIKIFHCAGEIDPLAHVKMVAAVQPFLSGAVSKTINLPHGATPEDVDRVYRTGHRLGVKAMAIYRDGSKLTQPLEMPMQVREVESVYAATVREEAIRSAQSAINRSIKGIEEVEAKLQKSPPRVLLPWRRERGFTQKVRISGNTVYLRVSEYEDGRPGEIFLELAHQGSTLRAMGNLFAIAVSIGLQHGIPVERFVKNFLHTKFEPAGIVEGHDHIRMVSSIADYVARELAITYLGRQDLAHAGNGPGAAPVAHFVGGETVINAGADGRRLHAGPAALTGDLCPECHNATLVQAGTCVYCRNCDFNTGCG